MNTLLINILGAFAIGAITALGAKTAGLDPRLTLLLKTGICGGFTTFSTFSLEALALLEKKAYFLGALYIALSVASAAYMLLSVTLSVAAVLLAEAVV